MKGLRPSEFFLVIGIPFLSIVVLTAVLTLGVFFWSIGFNKKSTGRKSVDILGQNQMYQYGFESSLSNDLKYKEQYSWGNCTNRFLIALIKILFA